MGLGLRVKSPGRGSGLLLRKGCVGVNGLRGDDGSVGVTGEVPFSVRGVPCKCLGNAVEGAALSLVVCNLTGDSDPGGGLGPLSLWNQQRIGPQGDWEGRGGKGPVLSPFGRVSQRGSQAGPE